MTNKVVLPAENIQPLSYDIDSLTIHEEDAILALKAAPDSGRLDVIGALAVTVPVIKFETLTFRNFSELLLNAIEGHDNFLAIGIKRLILDVQTPSFSAGISRGRGDIEERIVQTLEGARGSNGVNGADGVRPGGAKHGPDGKPGGSGGRGEVGKTYKQLNIYIFVQEFIYGSDVDPQRHHFRMNFRGIKGGTGGEGGDGGNGGKGADGRDSATTIDRCRKTAGDGGRGGDAGFGGKGGNGGKGSRGANLFIYTPDVSKFDFTTAYLEGGEGGDPGEFGSPGNPGRGGRGGRGSLKCSSGDRGGRGSRRPFPAIADKGSNGERGLQRLFVRDNSDLFL